MQPSTNLVRVRAASAQVHPGVAASPCNPLSRTAVAPVLVRMKVAALAGPPRAPTVTLYVPTSLFAVSVVLALPSLLALTVTAPAIPPPIVAGLPVNAALAPASGAMKAICPPFTGSPGCFGRRSRCLERSRKLSVQRGRLVVAACDGEVEPLRFERADVTPPDARETTLIEAVAHAIVVITLVDDQAARQEGDRPASRRRSRLASRAIRHRLW